MEFYEGFLLGFAWVAFIVIYVADYVGGWGNENVNNNGYNSTKG